MKNSNAKLVSFGLILIGPIRLTIACIIISIPVGSTFQVPSGAVLLKRLATTSSSFFQRRTTTTTCIFNNNNNDDDAIVDDIGIACIGGTDPDRPGKINQDAYFYDTIKIRRMRMTTGGDSVDDSTSVDSSSSSSSGDHFVYQVFGVLDGHGKNGHVLTKYLSNEIPNCIRNSLKQFLQEEEQQEQEGGRISRKRRDPSTVLAQEPAMVVLKEQLERLARFTVDYHNITSRKKKEEEEQQEEEQLFHSLLLHTFHSAQYNAIQEPTINAGINGATCIVVFMDMKQFKLHVAHVGDSRAICIHPPPPPSSSPSLEDSTTTTTRTSTTRTITPLTWETTIQNQEERQRIEQCEGSIRGQNIFYGPIGIAMTRALGDSAMLRAGIIPTPIIQSFTIQSRDIIIIATDGIWDVLSNTDIATIVEISSQTSKYTTTSCINTAQILCDTIVAAAMSKWTDLPVEQRIDDITCLVIIVS